MTREKTRFFLGLFLMICLVYFSVLREQQLLGHEIAILLSLTLVVLLLDYLKVTQFLALVREHGNARRSHDFAIQTALTATLRSQLLVKLLRSELLVLYYAFFTNFERDGVNTRHTAFSYAKSSNAHDVFLFVAFSQLPFLPFIHMLLEIKKGPGAAWAVTLLTIWSVVWFLAQSEAVKFRPIELSNDHLRYRFGISWSANIPLDQIKSGRVVAVSEELSGDDQFMSPLGSKRNVVLEFHTPIRFTGPYRQKRYETKAAMSLDHPLRFLKALESRGVVIRERGRTD
ncbi:MAG: hypothetical protein QNJ05_01165 [Woeseiaceae bacterium]|nr:hypothetical protein [Woeseiaceae bacterium]